MFPHVKAIIPLFKAAALLVGVTLGWWAGTRFHLFLGGSVPLFIQFTSLAFPLIGAGMAGLFLGGILFAKK